MEQIVGIATPRDEEVAKRSSNAELLMRSVCATLSSKPRDLVAAISLSLPEEPEHTAQQIVDTAFDLGIEYGLLVDASVNGKQADVSFTHRSPPLRNALTR